jgi:hypothetical protein
MAKRLEGVMNKLEQNKHLLDINNGYKGKKFLINFK